MKTRNKMAISAFMIITLVMGTGFEASTGEGLTEVENIAAEEQIPEEVTKSHGRPEFDGKMNSKSRAVELPEEIPSSFEVVVLEEAEEESLPEKRLLGEYTLTAYEATGNCCADGVYPVEWYTVACNDPALWHRKIYIEGYGDFYVHDTGGMPNYNILDVYLGDVSACYEFGVRTALVYVYE